MIETSSFRVLRKDVWMLGGEIDEGVGMDFFRAMVSTPPDRPLCILINCLGGDYFITQGIVHLLRQKFPIVETRVVGEVCSAAVDILSLGGTLRTALPNTLFHTHPTAALCEIKPHSGEAAGALLKESSSKRSRLYAKRTGKTLRFWERFFDQDKWFGPERALELGLIDQIL